MGARQDTPRMQAYPATELLFTIGHQCPETDPLPGRELHPQRFVVFQEALRLLALRHFGQSVPVVAGLAQQPEKLSPGVGAVQLIDVSAPRMRPQQLKTLPVRAVYDVRSGGARAGASIPTTGGAQNLGRGLWHHWLSAVAFHTRLDAV